MASTRRHAPEGGNAVRCLAAHAHSRVLIAGGTDGTARALDPRLRPNACVVATLGPFHTHAPISHLSMQIGASSPYVVAASPQGDIAVWDWRRAVAAASPNSPKGAATGAAAGSSAHAITSHKAGLSALAVHPQLPRVASGSRNQFIKLFDIATLRDGGTPREVHSIRYFDGFLGARIGPVTTLAFHPTRMLLAVGATDSVLSIYSS